MHQAGVRDRPAVRHTKPCYASLDDITLPPALGCSSLLAQTRETQALPRDAMLPLSCGSAGTLTHHMPQLWPINSRPQAGPSTAHRGPRCPSGCLTHLGGLHLQALTAVIQPLQPACRDDAGDVVLVVRQAIQRKRSVVLQVDLL